MISQTDPPVIVAGVVTYNRCDALRECLRGILTQTLPPGRVVMIDNASTDGTAAMLAHEFPHVTVHRMGENSGAAGGMHEALGLAMRLGAQYIWLLDDDAVPLPTCLEIVYQEMRVREERNPRIGEIRPLVSDPVTGDVMGGGMNHGTLLRAQMVAKVPLPAPDLFMGYDDKIYTQLVRRHGYEIVHVPQVLVRHPVRRRKSLRHIAAEGYHARPWRLYYGVRNRIYASLYVQRSPRHLLRSLAIATGQVALLTMFGRPRRGQALVLKGIVDGIHGRLGRRVQPPY